MKIEYLTIFLLYFSNIYKKNTHSDTLADQNSFGVLIKSGRTSGLCRSRTRHGRTRTVSAATSMCGF